MRKRISTLKKPFLAVLLFALLSQCSRDKYKAEIPTYITVDRIEMCPNVPGTRSSKFTTAWIQLGDKIQGIYELPVTFPVIGEGEEDLILSPGINENGISSFRIIHPFVADYKERIQFSPGDTIYLNGPGASSEIACAGEAGDSVPRVKYRDWPTIEILEDFEETGVQLQATNRSDVNITRTNDSSEVFPAPPGETNNNSGVISLPAGTVLAEIKTTEKYDLPTNGSSVYVELNYKTDIEFAVGIIAHHPGQSNQAPVVTVNRSEEWNKIYIDLLPEVSGNQNAEEFEIFIGTNKGEGSGEKHIYLDNIKLIY